MIYGFLEKSGELKKENRGESESNWFYIRGVTLLAQVLIGCVLAGQKTIAINVIL